MKSIADELPPEIARQINPDWRKNEAAYWAARDQLLSQYQGQWIGFADGGVIAAGTSPVAVFHAAEASGWNPFVVCVGREDEPCRTPRLVGRGTSAAQRPPMHEVVIRSNSDDYLKISFLGRSHPETADYWDGNWIQATVELKAGGFRGSVSGDLRADELVCFVDQLASLQELLSGTAEFETMEHWLSIKVTGDGCGHMEFCCVIRDEPGIGNTLEFTLTTDQTLTETTVAGLAAAVQAFPVLGTP